MKLIGHKFWDNIWLLRAIVLLMGLGLLLGGIRALTGGALHYRNYWGGVVFAPLAIVMGGALLVLLVVKWRTLDEREEELKGKAARRARQAHRARADVETFDEPWKGGSA